MSEHKNWTNARMQQYNITQKETDVILHQALSQALTMFDTLDWTTKEYARDAQGTAIDPHYATDKELKEICSVCLIGAVILGIYGPDNKHFITLNNKHRALTLANAYLRNRVNYEPESEGQQMHPTNWNDSLDTEEDGKTRVVAFLKKAIAAIQQEM